MSSFSHTTNGQPKVGFISTSSARKTLRKMQAKSSVHLRTYKCPKCRQIHIGRTNQSQSNYLRKRQITTTNERLVGRLIGILSKLLRKPANLTKTEEIE